MPGNRGFSCLEGRERRGTQGVEKISLSEPPFTVGQIIGQNECLRVSSQHKLKVFVFLSGTVYLCGARKSGSGKYTNLRTHIQTFIGTCKPRHTRPTSVLVLPGAGPPQKVNPASYTGTGR